MSVTKLKENRKMVINQEEYEILKSLDDKWKWLVKEHDESIFVYDMHPEKNWNNSDGKSKHISIAKGLFDGVTSEGFEIYSIPNMIDEFGTRKTLEEFFPINKEVD